jgi:hypothetical protein
MPREVLAEWLTALDRAGRRLPDESLPALLEIGRNDHELRPMLLAVLGERGRWLARQNPDWAYAGTGEAADEPAAIDATWQTGTIEARAPLLRRLRQMDPARGRELVASTWSAEQPSDRAAFLNAFEVGLTEDDEPFLEAALDDRRKEVRTAAAELLSRLPRSRLVRRMVERFAPLLSLPVEVLLSALESKPTAPVATKGAPFSKLDLPETCDKAMQRDGIEPKHPAGVKTGERAWWLTQMLGRIPPAVWCRIWGRSPQELVAATLKSMWLEELYKGLTEAAERYLDADWLEALLPYYERVAPTGGDIGKMIRTLPEERRRRAALGLLRKGSSKALSDDGLLWLASHVLIPWGDELAREILDRLPHNLAKIKHYDYCLKEFQRVACLRLPATAALQAASGWTVPEVVRSQFDEFVALLQFRHDMLKELSA